MPYTKESIQRTRARPAAEEGKKGARVLGGLLSHNGQLAENAPLAALTMYTPPHDLAPHHYQGDKLQNAKCTARS